MSPRAQCRIPPGRPVVVWGNCQSTPIAELLRGALAEHGCEVVKVPPVFEADEEAVAAVREVLRDGAALISQPVRDEYHVKGCGTQQLAELLPPDGVLVTIPVLYDSGPFPYQINAHGGDGARVSAPITDYHDLRALVAASNGLGVDDALTWWPVPSHEAVRRNAAASLAQLGRREAELDVQAGDLLGASAMFTLSHPQNSVLAEVARRILGVLGDPDGGVQVPQREFLGERRAPVEEAVVDALGWPGSARRDEWVVAGTTIDRRELLAEQLSFYAERPDVVADTMQRYGDRLALMELID